MLLVISPAKTLDFETPPTSKFHSQPSFLNDAEELIHQLKTLAPFEVSSLMKISDPLGTLNSDRFQQWHRPFTPDNSKQAMLAFKGDVYTGLAANTFTEDELEWANQHLRILSGLYGLLKPLDLIQPYRLEMGTKLHNQRGKNLYEFWGNIITDKINQDFEKQTSPTLVNLASNEYFKSIKAKQLNAEIITPIFKDWKNDRYKIISFYAKKARGLMSSYIIKNRIEEPEEIKNFDSVGYAFSASDSTSNEWVFLRREAL